MPDSQYEPLLQRLREFPMDWDGKVSIQELKEEEFQWRQMEWIGFYFEMLCRQRLSPPLSTPGPRYGNVEFDGFWKFPWDFKAHVSRNAKGVDQHALIVNDQEAIQDAIREYGQLGLVIAIGEAVFNDQDGSFKRWHDRLKGGISKYVQTGIREGRSSRVRKVSLHVQQFVVYRLDDVALEGLVMHRQGRNADGSPRRPKYALDLRSVDPVGVVKRSTPVDDGARNLF